MTVYYDYVPSPVSPFTFSPTLDGVVYQCSVTWGLAGARPYLNIYAVDGTWILTTALVGSPTGISLQALSWANSSAQATTLTPHGFKPGRVVTLTISGAVPDAYNGLVEALVTGPSTFTWPLAANPGPATVLGMMSQDIDIAGGLTDPNTGALLATTSTLVFRDQSNQFEQSP
jgi:hypothetical protein